MATTANTPIPPGTKARPAGSGTVQRALLLCGILSSLLYAATDLLGGLSYQGYSFTSQAISELGAIGAPSKALVDPLFVLYDALALAFAVAVFRVAGRSRALRITGALLAGHAVVGLTASASELLDIFPTFSMQQRGAGSLETDLPHIVLMGVIASLLLLAVGFGAFALGTRFRIYSFATVLTVIVVVAATAPYAARLAAGQPTPGFGILERVEVYALMLWLAVLTVALLRRRDSAVQPPAATVPATHVDGVVAPGFEEVLAEFERNFAERGEIGAAVAAYWRGQKVVDLWGGRRTPEGDAPWYQDTTVVVMSTTKALSAMTLAVATHVAGSTTTRPSRATGPSSRKMARRRSPCANSSATKLGWCCWTRSCRSIPCATSITSRRCSRGRSRRGLPERATATTR